jgi:hypothetical protein
MPTLKETRKGWLLQHWNGPIDPRDVNEEERRAARKEAQEDAASTLNPDNATVTVEAEEDVEP